MCAEILRIIFVLFGVLPLVLAQFTFKHIRIVNGVESVRDVYLQPRPEYMKTVASEDISHDQNHTLNRRWDGSQAYVEWQPTLNRGCTLDGMLNLDDAQAGKLFTPSRQQAHSDFLELNELMRWGYVVKALRKDPKCDMGNGKDAFGLEKYLHENDLSSDKADWECVRITHGDPDRNFDAQMYIDPLNPNRFLRVTGARYHIAINAKDGIIILAKQYSPAFMSQYRQPPVPIIEFPGMRASSDIMWMAWKKYHDRGARLSRIITWTITNGVTQRVLATALDPDHSAPDSQRQLQPYPWAGWTGQSTEGKALLGTPNGSGIGYFLAQHKPELGRRRIKRIEAFAADTQASGMREPTLVWELEDVPHEAQ